MDNDKIKNIVQGKYGAIAKSDHSSCCSTSSCCGSVLTNEEISKSIGYSVEEMKLVPEANLGLGCGNPIALSTIKEGDTVLDLGSGAGFDTFLAAKKVGEKGKVIGVDITKEMIEKAKTNAKKYGYANVVFKLGDIEQLPISDDSIDIITSNCVINLTPNKNKVFEESYRVLKSGGKLFISDIVLLEKLSNEQKNDPDLIASCIGGAILKDEYIEIIRNVGFKVKIISENKKISERQYNGIKLESIKIEASK